jgi:hypothetical protein
VRDAIKLLQVPEMSFLYETQAMLFRLLTGTRTTLADDATRHPMDEEHSSLLE